MRTEQPRSPETKEVIAEKAKKSIDATLSETGRALEQKPFWEKVKAWGKKKYEALKNIPTGWKLAGLSAASLAAAFMFGFDPLHIGKAGFFVGKLLFPRWTWLYTMTKYHKKAEAIMKIPRTSLESYRKYISARGEFSRGYAEMLMEAGGTWVGQGPLERLFGIAKIGTFDWSKLVIPE